MFKILAGILILYVTLCGKCEFAGLIDVVLDMAIISIGAGLDTIFHKKGWQLVAMYCYLFYISFIK